MSMKSYGLFEVIPNINILKEAAGKEYEKVEDFIEKSDMQIWMFPQYYNGEEELCYIIDEEEVENNHLDPDGFMGLVKDFVQKVYQKCGLEIYPVVVSSDADTFPGELVWAAPFELSEKLREVDSQMVVWTEFG